MIDTKLAKQETLKGNKDVLYYVEGDSPNVTSYARNLRGLQVRGDAQATILDKNRFSFITTSIPDPHTMSKLQCFYFCCLDPLFACIVRSYDSHEVREH